MTNDNRGQGAPQAPLIYHGTPMTPRDALVSVCTGRAMCVSFFRPDDVEVVEAISPDIMFRQWGILHVEGCTASWRGVGREMGLVGLLQVAGAAPFLPRSLGSCAGYAGSAEPIERCAVRPMAVRSEGRTPLAHGRAARSPSSLVRPI